MISLPSVLFFQIVSVLTIAHFILINISKQYKKIFKLDLAIFILITLGITSLYIFVPNIFYKFINGWPFNEWLINYQGGFVRRGFSGEVLFWLYKFDLQPKYIIFTISIISFYHIIFNILFLIKDRNVFYRLFVLFNPFGLFFLVQNIDFFFARRDLFYLNFFIFLGKRKSINFWYFFVLSVLLILNYGIYIFLIFTLYFVVSEKKQFDIKKFKYASLLFFIPLNILLLTVFRYVSDFDKLCKSINLLNEDNYLQKDFKYCKGAPEWFNKDFEPINSAFREIISGINYYNNFSNWLLVFLIFFICLFFVLEMNKDKFYRYLFLISPYFTLFFIAQDWSRWLVLIFLIFLINHLFSSEKVVTENKFKELLILPVLLNVFINIPSHLFRDLKIIDIRTFSEIFVELTNFLNNLTVPVYLIIYGYSPPILLGLT